MRRKILVAILFLTIVLMSGASSFAALFDFDDNMKAMTNHKMSNSVVGIHNSSYSSSSTSVTTSLTEDTSSGQVMNTTSSVKDYKVTMPSDSKEKDVSLVVKYPKYLKYGTDYYDVTLNITKVYSYNKGQKVSFGVILDRPGLRINDRSWNDREGANIQLSVAITNSSTGAGINPNVYKYYIGLTDIDISEVWRVYDTNLSHFWHHKNMPGTNALYYEVNSNSIDVSGMDTEDIDDPTQQNIYYEAPTATTTFRYGTKDGTAYASPLSFFVEDVNYTVNYQWSGAYPSGQNPPGSTTVRNGGTHAVNTTYNTSTTINATNVKIGNTTYPKGQWKFNGWDKSGTLTITSNTTITGTWTFTPWWDITSSVQNGTITPSESNIPNGQTRTYTYAPNTNYVLESVTVDGAQVNINTYKSIYTFSNITANHTIAVKYIPTYKVEYYSDAGGTVTNGHENQDPNNASSTRPRVVVNKQPTGANLVTKDDWMFEKWTTRKAVTLTDGTTIAANGTITMDQIKKVVVTEDLIFDAHHIPRPQIEISKVADERYRQSGEDVVFTIKAWNKRPYVDALMLNSSNEYVMTRVYTKETGIDISDVLPSELKLISVKAKNIGPSLVDGYELDVNTRTNSFSAHFSTLTDEKPEFIVTAEVNADVWYEEDYPNTATISGEKSLYPNGEDSDDDTAIVTVVKPNLEITKVQDADKYHLADTVKYTITVTNKQANSHADNVVISDSDLPQGFNITGNITASSGTVTQDGNSFTVAKDTLLGGESITVEFDCTIDKDALVSDQATNKVSVDCNELDPREADTTAQVVCDVTYEWDGPHPDKTVPDSELDIPWGSEYQVDTAYKAGDRVKDTLNGQKGSWWFDGWDKTGTLVIKDDTVIKGTWTFIPEYDITTEVEHGTITPSEQDIIEGENRVITYTPDEGYQLKSLTVDGEDKDITEYPASYTFENISSDHHIKAVFELIPELSVDKTSDKEIYNAGDTVTYTITVSQVIDGAEARDVRIKDTLPEGLTLNEDSIEGEGFEIVSTSANSYELLVKSLTDSVTYTYTAVTEKDIDHEELINVADAEGSNVPDPKSDDNKVKSLTPKPEIEKIVSNENPIYGEEITYWIKIKEPQEGIELRNAHIEDPLPEGVEPAEGEITIDGDSAEAAFSENIFRADIPVLSTETVFSFKAVVTAVEGEVDNIASLTGDDISELTDNALITVKEPEPKLTKACSVKEGSVGDTATYTVTASSDIALVDAVIEDTLPSGLELVEGSVKCSDESAEISASKGVITAKVKSLAEALTITYRAKITAKGEHVNTALLTAYNFPKGPLSAEAAVIGFNPVPIIEKSVSDETLEVGSTATYTVKARAEKGRIYNAVVTDKLPDGLELEQSSIQVSRADAKVEAKGNAITVSLDTLETEPVVITYKAKVKSKGAHKNIAVLSGDNVEKPAEANALINGFNPVPVIEKTASDESVTVGDVIDYEIKASSEKGKIYNAVIKDKLPRGIDLDEGTVAVSGTDAEVDISGRVITVKVDVLTEEPITIVYSATVAKKGEHINTATLTGDNVDEPAEAEAAVTGIPKPVVETGDKEKLIAPIAIFTIALIATLAFAYMRIKKKEKDE